MGQKRGDLTLLWSLALLLPPLSNVADMLLGSTLSPGSNSAAPWTLPNNTFSLSFTASPTSTSLLVAAITNAYGVPVWSAINGPVICRLVPIWSVRIEKSVYHPSAILAAANKQARFSVIGEQGLRRRPSQ
ncbi:unnamed protein product [Urochloa humidicola]